MSQNLVRCEDGRDLVVGWDAPFNTFYAQLFDSNDPRDDVPSKTVGYHPTEQGLSPECEHGPYPVPTMDALFKYVEAQWGLSDMDIDRAREALAEGL